MKQFYLILSTVLLAGGMFMESHAQQTYSFTTAGATGSLGPTQGQVNTAYASTNLNNMVTVLGNGFQVWTVPTSGMYRIEAYGAQGGASHGSNPGANGGLGAMMSGDFQLTAGQVFTIVVGQQGGGSGYGGGGGGGSYVATGANVPVCVAGGGGGALGGVGDSRGCHPGGSGLISTSGGTSNIAGGGTYGFSAPNTGAGGGTPGNGGMNGYGGGSGLGAGGAGFYDNGAHGMYLTTIQPKCFLQGSDGGAGDQAVNWGGFGGGGGTQAASGYGAGGGGYSGGGGGSLISNLSGYGGGGGSYNSGAAQTNSAGVNSGHGKVIIRELCNISLTANGPFVNNAICAGNSVTLSTNAVSNYSWSTGATSSVLVVSPNVTTTYSLAATSNSNCTAYAAITITVNGAIPNLTVVNTASSSAGICPNSTVNLLASGALTYTWAGGSQTVSNGVTFSPTLAATYTVTGANGCGNSTAVTSVSVHPLPLITPVASSGSLCSGSQLTLTAQGNAATYTWTGGSVPITNGTGFVPPTSTIYTLTGTSALSCTAAATIPVTVYVTPTLAPTAAPMIVCIGGSSTLSAVGALNYTWTSTTHTVNTSTMVVTPTSTGMTTYTVVKSNSNCSDTKIINVITNSLPTVAAIVMPSTVCALSPATLAAGGALTYTWTAPGTPNYTFTGASNVISPPVSTTYSVAASDGTCVNTATVHLATNPNPTVLASSSATSICQGESVSLNASGATNYTWTTGTNTLYTQSITDSPMIPTAYQVVGDNSFGCTSQASQIVLVYGSPTLSAGPDKSLICNGTPVTFTASGASSYTWDANAGNATGSSVVLNPSTTLSGPVIYTVTGTNTIGCLGTQTTQVHVYIPSLSVSGNTNACKGSTLSLTASGGNSGSYTWHTANTPNSSGATLTTSLTAASVFTVSANTTSATVTCPVSHTVQVGLYPDPAITAIAQRTTICTGESSELHAGGGVSYSWDNGATGSTITVSPKIQTNYTVTGTDNNGCKNTATVQVRVSGCVGIQELAGSLQEILVYPNPNNGEFTIRAGAAEMKLTLVNELGQLIQSIELSAANNYQVSLKDLANGVYFVNGKQIHQKIIVAR
jgi:hypothetical protein